MTLSEAKIYVGQTCSVTWKDRANVEHSTISRIYDCTYVPLYGGYLVLDQDDVHIDRICNVSPMPVGEIAPCHTQAITASSEQVFCGELVMA